MGKRKVVRVTWGDAHSCFPHWTKFKKQKPRKIITVGWLFQDDELGVTVVQSVDHGIIGDGIFIPRANIEEIEEL